MDTAPPSRPTADLTPQAHGLAKALGGLLLAASALAVAWGANWLLERPLEPVESRVAGPEPAIVEEPPVQLPALPRLLSETGLFAAGTPDEIASGHWFYVPQYALWSDGATKRRWISLPPGAAIDATNPDAWSFPVGTRFWKEFRFGERVETRMIERLPDGTFRYASYVWDAARGDAVLAPERGLQNVWALGDGVSHDVPSVSDCKACHEGRSTPVLGFGALQLSPDRDPNALHAEPLTDDAVELPELVERGLLKHLPEALLEQPPRIAAASPSTRAALGYLYGNCAGCHNAEGPLADLGLDFDVSVASEHATPGMSTTFGRLSQFQLPGAKRTYRATAGDAEHSAMWFRMRSRVAAQQMPPLGSELPDAEGVALVEQWINSAPHGADQHE